MLNVNDFGAAVAKVRAGLGEIHIATHTRITVLKKKNFEAFDKAGIELFKVDGNGFRLAQGKGSVYVLAETVHVGTYRTV